MTNLHSKAFKYSLLICINIRHPRNSAKFDCNIWILHGYLSFYNLAMFVDGKVRNMPKVSKLCTGKVYNLHVSAFKYSLLDVHKFICPTPRIMLNWQ